jgi:hypothetical protein
MLRNSFISVENIPLFFIRLAFCFRIYRFTFLLEDYLLRFLVPCHGTSAAGLWHISWSMICDNLDNVQ